MNQEKDICDTCKRELKPDWIICPFCGRSETHQYFQLQKAYEEEDLRYEMKYHYLDGLCYLFKKLKKEFRATSKSYSKILRTFHEKISWSIPEDLKSSLKEHEKDLLGRFGDGFYPDKTEESGSKKILSGFDKNLLLELCVENYLYWYQLNGSDFLYYFKGKSRKEVCDIYKLNESGLRRKGNSVITDTHPLSLFNLDLYGHHRLYNFIGGAPMMADRTSMFRVLRVMKIFQNELSYFRLFHEAQDIKKRVTRFLFQNFKEPKDLKDRFKKRIDDLEKYTFINSDTKNKTIFSSLDDIKDIFRNQRDDRIKIEKAIMDEYLRNREYYDEKLNSI